MTFDEYSKLDEEGRMQVAVAHAAASVVGRDIQVVRRSESMDLNAQVKQLSSRLMQIGATQVALEDRTIEDDQPRASEEQTIAQPSPDDGKPATSAQFSAISAQATAELEERARNFLVYYDKHFGTSMDVDRLNDTVKDFAAREIRAVKRRGIRRSRRADLAPGSSRSVDQDQE